MLEKAPNTTPIFSRDWLIRLAATVTAIGVMWAFITPFYVRFIADDVTAEAREKLGVARMEENQEQIRQALDDAVSELSSHLEAIEGRLGVVANQAERAIGADGILELKAGSAYVAEPIFVGDDIVRIHAEARRTTRGLNCTLTSRVGVFEAQGGRIVTGDVTGPLRQLGGEYVDYEFIFQAPAEVTSKPGRVSVVIESIYDCAGTVVRDVRPALSFTVNRIGDQGAGPGALAGPGIVRRASAEDEPVALAED